MRIDEIHTTTNNEWKAAVFSSGWNFKRKSERRVREEILRLTLGHEPVPLHLEDLFNEME